MYFKKTGKSRDKQLNYQPQLVNSIHDIMIPKFAGIYIYIHIIYILYSSARHLEISSNWTQSAVTIHCASKKKRRKLIERTEWFPPKMCKETIGSLPTRFQDFRELCFFSVFGLLPSNHQLFSRMISLKFVTLF